MLSFFRLDGIEYDMIEDQILYPQAQIKSGMQRCIDIAESSGACDPVLIRTPFDKDALFEWTKQLFGETINPSCGACLGSERRRGKDYYKIYMSSGRSQPKSANRWKKRMGGKMHLCSCPGDLPRDPLFLADLSCIFTFLSLLLLSAAHILQYALLIRDLCVKMPSGHGSTGGSKERRPQ